MSRHTSPCQTPASTHPGFRCASRLLGVLGIALVGLASTASEPAEAANGFNLVRTTTLSTVGGSGGVAYGPDFCPTNKIVTGVRASDRTFFLGKFSVQCSTVSLVNGVATTGSPQNTPDRGTTGNSYGTPQSATCNSTEAVVGLHLWKNGSNVLSGIAVRCRTISLVNDAVVLTGSVRETSSIGLTGRNYVDLGFQSSSCATGDMLMGHEGSEGDGLDNFKGFCGTFQQAFVTASIAATNFSWPTSWTITATDAATISTDFVDGIKTKITPSTYSNWAASPSPKLDPASYTVKNTSCPSTVSGSTTSTCSIAVTGKPDARIALTGPATISAGATDKINVAIDNWGPGTASTSFSLTAPTGVTWSTNPSCLITTNTINCDGPALKGSSQPGVGQATVTSLAIEFSVDKATSAGTVTFKSAVSATGDFDTTNDKATFDMGVKAAVTSTSSSTTSTTTASTTTVKPSTTTIVPTTSPATTVALVYPCPYGKGTIQGDVVMDLNGNGIVDENETSISDVVVELRSGAATCQTGTTHSPYVFSNVGPGDYDVVILGKPGLPGSTGQYRVTVVGAGTVTVPAKLVPAPVTSTTSEPVSTVSTTVAGAANPSNLQTTTPTTVASGPSVAAVPEVPSATAPTDALALTGSSTIPMVAVALALIGVGALVTRRTRKN